jgi:hypothetical protein
MLSVFANMLAQTIDKNENNVFGRAALRADTCDVMYLGQHSNEQSCIAACTNATKPACHAWTYHRKEFPDPAWAEGCYGATDFTWDPQLDDDVDSGKVGAWPAKGKCASDSQCNYNGKCQADGKCKCDPQWSGAGCDELRLLPVNRSRPTGYFGRAADGSNATSWGGSVILDDDGVHHM